MRLGSLITLQRAKPGSILTLPSQKAVEDSEVSRESDGYVYGVLLVGFTHLASTVNTPA